MARLLVFVGALAFAPFLLSAPHAEIHNTFPNKKRSFIERRIYACQIKLSELENLGTHKRSDCNDRFSMPVDAYPLL